LTLSEKHLGYPSKANNEIKNVSKLFLLLLFPFFQVQDIWHYEKSTLYPIFRYGKDLFYRFVNESQVNWRKVLYRLNMQLIRKVENRGSSLSSKPKCLIIDDTDLPKTGMRIELIGKIFSHTHQRMILGFKGLFLGYFDGKSFFSLDFSLHGEKGKNKKIPFGLKKKQLQARYSKARAKLTPGYLRVEEYFISKIQSMIKMLRGAIKAGLRFDYVLVDSWFVNFKLVKFIYTRRISTHLLGMARMGKTKYMFNNKLYSANQIIDKLRKSKKLKRSKKLSFYYSEVIVDFQGIPIKLLFSKISKRGKWSLLLTTDLNLTFEKAYEIYSIRWQIEVFFKESKHYLGLGKSQSQDFDAQIANISTTMIQYNILVTAKRFISYETIGQLFEDVSKDSLSLTVAEKIWKIIIEILTQLGCFFETEPNLIMEKLISDNEQVKKIVNFNALLQAG
jgi:hypothetical protein